MPRKLLVFVANITLSQGKDKKIPTATVSYNRFSERVVHFDGPAQSFIMENIEKASPIVAEILRGDPVAITSLPFPKAKALREFTSQALKECLSEVMEGLSGRNGMVTIKLSKLHPMIRSAITEYLCAGQNPDEARKTVNEHYEGVVEVRFMGLQRFPIVHREDLESAVAA